MTYKQIILNTINEHQPLNNKSLADIIGNQIENKASLFAIVSALRKEGKIETTRHGMHSLTTDGELELVLPDKIEKAKEEAKAEVQGKTQNEYGYNTIVEDDSDMRVPNDSQTAAKTTPIKPFKTDGVISAPGFDVTARPVPDLSEWDLRSREGLPDELIKQLSSQFDKVTDQDRIIKMLRSRGRPMDLDEIIVAWYKLYNEIKSRKGLQDSLLKLRKRQKITKGGETNRPTYMIAKQNGSTNHG